MSRQLRPEPGQVAKGYVHDQGQIFDFLSVHQKAPSAHDVDSILNRALSLCPMRIEDAIQLIRAIEEPALFSRIIAAADQLRRRGFGESVKVYVPIYISNYCSNNCIYCSFRRNNRHLNRRLLDRAEFLREIDYLLSIGHRNIEVVLGYDERITNGSDLARFIEPLRLRLDALGGGTIIMMTEPMDVADYAELRAAGATEVYSWQETYHRVTYATVHGQGSHKSCFDWRTQIFDRALEGGIPRIGMGFMFGLYRWDYEELSLAAHAFWIRETYGVEPYAFGVPRFQPAEGVPLKGPRYKVSDEMYRMSVAIRRLLFPYTHTYMNTRESFEFLLDLLASGGTEINTEASTVPGGYTQEVEGNQQFFHYSFRSDTVFGELEKAGYSPTFGEIEPRF